MVYIKGDLKKMKLIMSLSCEFCDRKFPTNASLYVHKQTQHSPPKLLTDAIFNCTSMQEILEIMHLVKNHRIDVVVQRHLKTLQNLLLSLLFGVLPICQPQREKITNKQRELVEKIQSASPNRAKGIMKEHRDELTNLFAIIEDSLNLARDSYNKYGTDKSSI